MRRRTDVKCRFSPESIWNHYKLAAAHICTVAIMIHLQETSAPTSSERTSKKRPQLSMHVDVVVIVFEIAQTEDCIDIQIVEVELSFGCVCLELLGKQVVGGRRERSECC